VGLELCNAALFFVLNGLIFGGLMTVLGYWAFQNEWLKVILVIPVCWLIAPVIVQIIARWRVCSYEGIDAIGAQRWARAGSVSGWIFGTAVAMTALCLTRHYRNLLLNASDVAGGGESDAFKEFMFGLKFHVALGIAVAIIALAVTLITWMMRRRLKGAGEEFYS